MAFTTDKKMNMELEKILNDLNNDTVDSAISHLSYIESEIEKTITLIGKTQSLKDAKTLFEILENIHVFLAKLSFKYDVELSPQLKKFVYDFDRIDDLETQMHLYSDIRNNEYKL